MDSLQGSTWIMLRGLAREHRHWEKFPQLFQSTFPSARVIAPDLPGTGAHNRERSPTRIGDIVESVRDDIGATGLKAPVYILGLSMGGMVALEWTRRYPQECSGVVLMNTSLRGGCPFYQRFRPRNYWLLLRSLVMRNNICERENRIFDISSNLNPDREAVISNWVRYARENPVSKQNAVRQLIAAALYKLPEHRPEVPLLLLNSLGDRMVDPGCSHSLARAWNLPLHTHPTAGHDLTLDDGPWVCEQIANWVGQ